MIKIDEKLKAALEAFRDRVMAAPRMDSDAELKRAAAAACGNPAAMAEVDKLTRVHTFKEIEGLVMNFTVSFMPLMPSLPFKHLSIHAAPGSNLRPKDCFEIGCILGFDAGEAEVEIQWLPNKWMVVDILEQMPTVH